MEKQHKGRNGGNINMMSTYPRNQHGITTHPNEEEKDGRRVTCHAIVRSRTEQGGGRTSCTLPLGPLSEGELTRGRFKLLDHLLSSSTSIWRGSLTLSPPLLLPFSLHHHAAPNSSISILSATPIIVNSCPAIFNEIAPLVSE